MPQRVLRSFAWVGLGVAMILLGLTRTPLGVEVNGNTNWLALGPVQIQPSEIAKLAVILWAAHVYANKERRLHDWHQLLMPVVPGVLLVAGLVIIGHDLGTALVILAILLGMIWWPAPRRAVRVRLHDRRRLGVLPRDHQPRAATAPVQLRRPVQGLPRRGLAAGPRPLRPVHRWLVRPGHRRQPAEVGRPPGGAHRLHLRRARRGARPDRHLLVLALFLTIA